MCRRKATCPRDLHAILTLAGINCSICVLYRCAWQAVERRDKLVLLVVRTVGCGILEIRWHADWWSIRSRDAPNMESHPIISVACTLLSGTCSVIFIFKLSLFCGSEKSDNLYSWSVTRFTADPQCRTSPQNTRRSTLWCRSSGSWWNPLEKIPGTLQWHGIFRRRRIAYGGFNHNGFHQTPSEFGSLFGIRLGKTRLSFTSFAGSYNSERELLWNLCIIGRTNELLGSVHGLVHWFFPRSLVRRKPWNILLNRHAFVNYQNYFWHGQ